MRSRMLAKFSILATRLYDRSTQFVVAKSLGIEKLYADIDEGNFRSQALFRKLGFKAQAGQFQRTL